MENTIYTIKSTLALRLVSLLAHKVKISGVVFLTLLAISSFAQGSFDISRTNISADVGSMGNATVSLPIFCAAGRLGIKPTVNLAFSSQTNSGILGKGWSFTGLSVISRIGNNFHLDNGTQETVTFGNNDKLALDGQRLLLVEGSQTEFIKTNNVYRTEVDVFSKVTFKFNGSVTYFEVDTKEGGKIFYGLANNSQHKPVGTSNVLSWYICKSYDRNGNYLEYFYDNTNGQITLSEIKYTGYDCTLNGTKPCGNPAEASFNKITFQYEVTPNNAKQFVGGGLIQQNKRVAHVYSYVDNTMVRHYSMTYDSDGLHSYLKTVQEENQFGEKKFPIELTWEVDGTLERKMSNIDGVEHSLSYQGDFNGDGKADLLIVEGELSPLEGKLLSHPTFKILRFDLLTGKFVEYGSGTIPRTNISAIVVGDLNADGLDDIFVQTATMTQSGQDRTDHDWYNPCPNYDRYKLNNIAYRYSLFETLNNSNNTYSNYCFSLQDYVEGPLTGIPVVNPGYGNHFSSEDQLWKFLTVQPMLVDADGDGHLDLVLKETWAKRNVNTNWCSDPAETSVDNNENIINIHFYLSSINKDLMQSDGRSEYVKFKYIYTGSVTRATNFVPMDFNGNGKTDFMITYVNSKTAILEYSNATNALEHIYGTGTNGFPTPSHKHIQTGDFNGDGKTDLLYFVVNKWYVAYSTGIAFDEHNASDSWFLHGFHSDLCRQFLRLENNVEILGFGFKFDIGDFNGDGRDDIVERHHHDDNHTNHTANFLHVYYSKGFGFTKETIAGGNYLHTNNKAYDLGANIIADFNGDGKKDVLLFNSNIESIVNPNTFATYEARNILLESFKAASFKLASVAYSDKHKYSFTYNNMNRSSHYSFIRGGLRGKCILASPPLIIVETMTTEVAGLLSKTYNYGYQSLIYHKHGRGLLGFMALRVTEEKTNGIANTNKQTSISTYKQNLEFPYKLDLSNTIQYRTINGNSFIGVDEISRTEYTNTNINTTTDNPDINFFYTSYTVETNNLSGLRKATCFIYDENGNLTHKEEAYDRKTNATGVKEYTNTSDYKYAQYNSWLPSSLTISMNCHTRDGNSSYYVRDERQYFLTGNLSATEYFKNNLSYYYKEMLNYDKYGNITTTELDSANNASSNTFRKKVFTYESGRFLETITNALGQQTVFEYEHVYGNKKYEKGPNNLITTYDYDKWGRLIQTNLPSGNYERIEFYWAPFNTNNEYYVVAKSNNLGNYTWEYYDALDRKVKVETQVFLGNIATQSFVYNTKGQLLHKSNAYDANNLSSKILTTHTYDQYDRIETVTYNNVLMETYIYTYGTTTTAFKDGKDRIKTTTLNATGLVQSITDPIGGTIVHNYGPHNKVIKTTTNGSEITFGYNVQLNKISMNDPNTGTTQYDYNAFGELIAQKDSRGNDYYFEYDDLGRVTKKWGCDELYTYTYYNNVGVASLNQLEKEELKIGGVLKHRKKYIYTALGVIETVKELAANNIEYETKYSYKTNQQLLKVAYPNIAIRYHYDDYNNVKEILNDADNTSLWKKEEEYIDGKPKMELYGNGYVNTYTYDGHRQLMNINSFNNSTNETALNATYQFEIQTGNLLNRQINGVISEVFTYDNMDRLTNIAENISGMTDSKVYNYQTNGNISTINSGGLHTLEYNSNKPHAFTNHKFNNYANIHAPQITEHEYIYTHFNKIQDIDQTGTTLHIDYGVDQQRIYMQIAEFGSITVDNYYVGSANMEIKNGEEYTYIYIGATPIAIHKKTGNELYYLHLDHQNSLMAITNQWGGLMERRTYDAWGRPREHGSNSYVLWGAFGGAGSGITMRGYTMHEHLDMFSLINMNGRLYDPVLGRMLSADNFIQNEENSQNYNRYSYVLNNPLKYTDPDGNNPAAIGWALVGAYLGGAAANNWEMNPAKWDPSNPGTYFGIALGAAAGYAGAAAGIPFSIGANLSGVSLPLARISVGQNSTSVSLGFGADNYGGYLGGDFVIAHNKANSKHDWVMNDYDRMVANREIASPTPQSEWGDVYANADNYQRVRHTVESTLRYIYSQKEGFSITGEEISNFDEVFKKASGIIKSIDRVGENKIRVNLTLGGNMAISLVPDLTFKSGALFMAYNTKDTEGNRILRVVAVDEKQFKFNGHSGVFIKGNDYSRYLLLFEPIFKK